MFRWRSRLSYSKPEHHHGTTITHALEAVASQGAVVNPIDLDWKPFITWPQRVGILAFSAAVAYTCYACTRSSSLSWPPLVGAAIVFALAYRVVAAIVEDAGHGTRMVLEKELADPDSKFRDMQGLTVHLKVKDGHTSSNPVPSYAVHCYHGFGASTFSWGFVQSLLAQKLSTVVTSHDMPGFGLTQRPQTAKQFLLSYNACLGRVVLDAELASRTLIGTGELRESMERLKGGSTSAGSAPTGSPSRIKRVVMGHSLGTICAAMETLSHPQDVRALILVAPAILAFPGKEYQGVSLQPVDNTYDGTDLQVLSPVSTETKASAKSSSSSAPKPRLRLLSVAGAVAKSVLLVLTVKIFQLLQPLISFWLRGLVRSREFWQKGVMAAYYERSRVTPEVVDGYRRALLVKGFDTGFLQFLYARLLPENNPWKLFKLSGAQDTEDANLAGRLSALVGKHNIRVLIVHGSDDRLVPAANSKRLARMLPGCQLVVVPKCGHVPHEELPEQFVDIVSKYLDVGIKAEV